MNQDLKNIASPYPEIIQRYKNLIYKADLYKMNGKVSDVVGLVIISTGPNVSLGELCIIVDRSGNEVCKSEVVGFKEGKVLSIAIGEVHNISPSCEIIKAFQPVSVMNSLEE
jgi:flagellum-specific ATP synthase